MPTTLTSASAPSAVYRSYAYNYAVMASDGAPPCLRTSPYSLSDTRYTAGTVGTVGTACEQATLIDLRSSATTVRSIPVAYATPSGSVRFTEGDYEFIAPETVDGPSAAPVTALDVAADPPYAESGAGSSHHVVFTRSDSQVYYAVRTAGVWRVSSISAALGGMTGSSPTVVTDHHRRPHIVFLSGGTAIEVTW